MMISAQPINPQRLLIIRVMTINLGRTAHLTLPANQNTDPDGVLCNAATLNIRHDATFVSSGSTEPDKPGGNTTWTSTPNTAASFVCSCSVGSAWPFSMRQYRLNPMRERRAVFHCGNRFMARNTRSAFFMRLR